MLQKRFSRQFLISIFSFQFLLENQKKYAYLFFLFKTMKKQFFILRIFRFYLEGFRSMTLGKTLWLIILIKLFILFVILKVFFFPDYLKKFETPEEKREYISSELINRAIHP
jgi:hypothetical protein